MVTCIQVAVEADKGIRSLGTALAGVWEPPEGEFSFFLRRSELLTTVSSLRSQQMLLFDRDSLD